MKTIFARPRGWGRAGLAALSVILLVSASGCDKAGKPVQALEPNRQTTCALDGMSLLDFPGPKAQIHYGDGETDFFCDTMEMFSVYLKPEQQRRITAIFTQDMGQADWKTPKGHWIDAKRAYYVLGSDMPGSMGPTLASFARLSDADAFSKKHGGKVLSFSQITSEMVTLDGGVVRDERM